MSEKEGSAATPQAARGERSREVIYSGAIVDLVRLDSFWEVVEHAPGVAVLVVRDGQVLGVEQFREAIGAVTWELPAGLVDEGEEPVEAARRELAEETGLSGDLHFVTSLYTSPGFTDEEIFLYEATGLHEVDAQPDETEDLKVVWRDLREAWKLVTGGRLKSSSPTMVGLAYALNRLENGEGSS